MGQQEVFKKIGGIFHELIAQYEYFRAGEQNLNELELEIFVANINFLKDHAEILRKLNAQKSLLPKLLPSGTEQAPAGEKPVSNEPKYFEPVVQQIKPAAIPVPANPETNNTLQPEPAPFKITPPAESQGSGGINLRSDTPADSYSYTREEEGTIRHELILDEADTWDDDEPEHIKETPTMQDKLSGEIKEDASAEKNNGAAPLQVTPTLSVYADIPDVKKTDEPLLTLNERLSAKLKEQGATPALPEQGIQDIKAAINLNDKMLFVKDLFNGYTLAYTEAVEILNRFTTLEEADLFLKSNYAIKNNWETKKATADKFYSLLKRRYA